MSSSRMHQFQGHQKFWDIVWIPSKNVKRFCDSFAICILFNLTLQSRIYFIFFYPILVFSEYDEGNMTSRYCEEDRRKNDMCGQRIKILFNWKIHPLTLFRPGPPPHVFLVVNCSNFHLINSPREYNSLNISALSPY